MQAASGWGEFFLEGVDSKLGGVDSRLGGGAGRLGERKDVEFAEGILKERLGGGKQPRASMGEGQTSRLLFVAAQVVLKPAWCLFQGDWGQVYTIWWM